MLVCVSVWVCLWMNVCLSACVLLCVGMWHVHVHVRVRVCICVRVRLCAFTSGCVCPSFIYLYTFINPDGEIHSLQ